MYFPLPGTNEPAGSIRKFPFKSKFSLTPDTQRPNDVMETSLNDFVPVVFINEIVPATVVIPFTSKLVLIVLKVIVFPPRIVNVPFTVIISPEIPVLLLISRLPNVADDPQDMLEPLYIIFPPAELEWILLFVRLPFTVQMNPPSAKVAPLSIVKVLFAVIAPNSVLVPVSVITIFL